MIRGMLQLTLTVHEIRLLSDGMHIEVGFLSWLGGVRERNRYTMHIADLKPPPLYSDSLPLDGDHFPVSTDVFDIPIASPEPWVKYSDVVRRHHFIPKQFDYLDREMMVAVLNGYYIDTTNS